MKTYEIKTYSFDGTFKKTINPKDLSSVITFQEELNGGQGDINISLRGNFDDFMCSDIVEIREKNDRDSGVVKTYTGIIEEIDVKEFVAYDELVITVLGVFTVLNDEIYKSGGSRTVTITNTPGNIVKSIIDSFNTDYGTLVGGNTQNLSTNIVRYTASSIDITGTTISRTFTNSNCLDAIKDTLKDTGFDFFIGADGIVYVTQKVNQTEVFLTHEREILYISRTVTKKDMYNKLYLERNGGTVLTYSDAPSSLIYGVKEKYESDTTINDATTQNTVGEKKISEFKIEKNVISFNLKPQKSDYFYPGVLITTQNTRKQVTQAQVTKIDKNFDGWKVYIGNFVSFGKTVLGG